MQVCSNESVLSIHGSALASIVAPPPRYSAFRIVANSGIHISSHDPSARRTALRIADYCRPPFNIHSNAHIALQCTAAQFRVRLNARCCGRVWLALVSNTIAANTASKSWGRAASRALQLRAVYSTHLLLRRAEIRAEQCASAERLHCNSLVRAVIAGWAHHLALLRNALLMRRMLARRLALQVINLLQKFCRLPTHAHSLFEDLSTEIAIA
jgi:hypothetical protein